MNVKEINHLLKEHKAVLVRSKRHNIWRFPNGKSISISQSPSDRRALKEIKKTILHAIEDGNNQ